MLTSSVRPVSRRLVRDLFVAPLLSQRSRLVGIAGSLLVLALSEALFLLLVKGFIKALFTDATKTTVQLSDLLPAKAMSWAPALSGLEVASATLAVAVPIMILVAGWCKSLASYLYQLNQQALAIYLARTYREKLFRTLISLPYTEITKRQVGAWMSLIMNDVMLLQTRFTDIMTGLIKDTVATFACYVVLAIIHWPSALALFVLSPFIAFGMGRTGKRIARYAEVYQRELGAMAAAILDIRARLDFIRAQQGEAREKARFAAMNMAYFRMIRRSILVRSAFAPVLEFGGFAVFALSIYAIGSGYWGNFTPEVMLQFFVALGLLLRPLREMGEQLARFHETRGTLMNSLEVFSKLEASQRPLLQGETASQPLGISTLHPEGLHIALIQAGMAGQVRFQSRGLRLIPGRSVAVIGPSGAGKSTLIKTLSGLVEPLGWEANLEWRTAVSLVSMVSQDPFLFDDSIVANLRYGLNPEQAPTEEMLWQALRTVNIDHEMQALPEQLSTRLRAIGSNVSGGQLQRLVIARALLRRRPIWLLDEATSAVDARSEKDITQRLIASCRDTGHALLVVTHRLTWLESFDEVWFVEAGTIALAGTHLALLADPRYQAFVGSVTPASALNYLPNDL